MVKRQVFEPGRFGHFEVTAHVAEVKECSCGHVTHASFPEGVDAHVQYGSVTQALAVYLWQYQLVPYKHTSRFFMDIFGLEVSPGSVCTFQQNAYDQLYQFRFQIMIKQPNCENISFSNDQLLKLAFSMQNSRN